MIKMLFKINIADKVFEAIFVNLLVLFLFCLMSLSLNVLHTHTRDLEQWQIDC